MADIEKWIDHGELSDEDEPLYLKDLCAYLRDQYTIGKPEKNPENDRLQCEIVTDDLAAHAADVIEELYKRVQNLQYELREAKSV